MICFRRSLIVGVGPALHCTASKYPLPLHGTPPKAAAAVIHIFHFSSWHHHRHHNAAYSLQYIVSHNIPNHPTTHPSYLLSAAIHSITQPMKRGKERRGEEMEFHNLVHHRSCNTTPFGSRTHSLHHVHPWPIISNAVDIPLRTLLLPLALDNWTLRASSAVAIDSIAVHSNQRHCCCCCCR